MNVLAVLQEAKVTPPGLTLDEEVLDRALGPWERARVTLLEGDGPLPRELPFRLCVRAVAAGSEVVYVDGGNSMNPYEVVRLARREGLARHEVLPYVHVARAFTVHQMATLVLEGLEEVVREKEPALLVLACLGELFLDEDVRYGEACTLLRRCVQEVRRVTAEYGTVTVVSQTGGVGRRRTVRALLHEGADEVVRIRARPKGWEVAVPRRGLMMRYRPVVPSQARLDDFVPAFSMEQPFPRAPVVLLPA